jgi:hypothetical protein
VEAPIVGVVVLGAALVAERERAHRRAVAIVWEALDQRVPRAAARAVRERVEVAARGGIEHLGDAAPRTAPGPAGCSAGSRRALGAACNRESPITARRGRGRPPTVDPGRPQAPGSGASRRILPPLPFDLDPDRDTVVPHEAREPERFASRNTVGRKPTPWTYRSRGCPDAGGSRTRTHRWGAWLRR